MFTALLAVVALVPAFAAALPASGSGAPPAWFDPTKKYPAAHVGPYNNTAQGQYASPALQAAWSAVKKLGAQAQPLYGPGSFVTDPTGLSWYDSNFNDGTAGVSPTNSYTCFNGQVSAYPARSQWMSFYKMFNLNQANGMASTAYGAGADTGEQQGEIYNAILSVSGASKVDARLILATIMQESGGCVNVPCTAGYNCGLMQANHGSVSYNPGNSIAQSQASINQMVTDGTEGTTQGPGYVQYLNGGSAYSYTRCPGGNPYATARAYNTGSCSASGNMNCAQYGTASYVNDIANRLIGWDGTGAPQGRCGFPAVGCV